MNRPAGPLHIKYRPRNVDEIKGNQPAKDAIKDAFNKEVIPKVYLITGPAGCGKTSIAYIIRDLLGCHRSAFNEFDASTDRGIDKLRKIKSDAELHPLVGEVSVIFFDECHGITGTAQESMLKMLETPPPHVYCVLATTEPAKLKPTLQRRCHKIPVDFLTRADTVQLLTEVAEEEERKWMSAKVFGAIYKSSGGSPGNAVQLLDQVITLCPVDAPENVRMEKEQEAINIIESVTYSQGFVIDLCRTLANRKLTGEEKWEQCKVLLKDFKGNAESSRLAVMAYFEKILFNTNHPAVARTMATFNEPMIHSGRSGLTLATYYACRDFIEDEKRGKK